MKFLCLICAEKMLEHMSPADAQQHMDEYREFTQGIKDAGNYVTGDRLVVPEDAVTIRVRNGRVLTTDGPFAETKEQLGGFYIIEAPDQVAAVQIASRIPGAKRGCVEIRPIADDPATRRALLRE